MLCTGLIMPSLAPNEIVAVTGVLIAEGAVIVHDVSNGGYRGRAKEAVAPPSALNTILFNTKMSCSPPPLEPWALGSRWNCMMTKKVPKRLRTGQTVAVVLILGHFRGRGNKSGHGLKISLAITLYTIFILAPSLGNICISPWCLHHWPLCQRMLDP